MSIEAPKTPYRHALLRPDRPPTGAGPWWSYAAMVALAALMAAGWWRTRRAEDAARCFSASVATRPMELADAWGVGRRPDGALEVIRGGARLVVALGRVAERAEVTFASRILAATPIAGAWVFVAEDRSVAVADSFLGAPRDLGRLPCATRVDRGGQGLATAVGPDGALYATAGRGPFARVEAPGPTRAAAFATRSVGALIRRDGGVEVTRDGGATWRPEALFGDVGWAFARGADGLSLVTLTRTLALGAGGALVAAQGDPLPLTLPATASEPARTDVAVADGFRSAAAPGCSPPGDALPDPVGPRFRCQVVGAVVDPIADGGYFVDTLHLPRHPRAVSPSVHGQVWWYDDGSNRHGLRVRWRAADGAGAVGSSETYREDFLAHPSSPELVALATTRAGVLLVDDLRHRLVWGVDRGDFVDMAEPFYDRSPHAQAVARTVSLALDDGGALVLLTREVYRGGPGEGWDTTDGLVPRLEHVGVALEVAPGGVLRARRPVALGDATFGLAARGAERGVVLRRGDALTLLPMGGGPAMSLPSMPARCPTACRAGTLAGSPWRVALPRACASLAFEADALEVDGGAVELALTPTGACVRALNAVEPGERVISLEATPAGDLVGHRAQADRIRCVHAAASALPSAP